MFSANPK